MLTVKTSTEVFALLEKEFRKSTAVEIVEASKALGRVLAEDLLAKDYVPGFHRSTVDGYALKASDTFGCSDAMPAILTIVGEVLMGEEAGAAIRPGECKIIPTGGAVPEGADAVVMLEYCEEYGDGTVGIGKPAGPGTNMIYKGDDVFPGKTVLPAGRKLSPQDIGSMAAMGITEVSVVKKPLVGIISTGDELVPVTEEPKQGQIRDVNSVMLYCFCTAAGAEAKNYGIMKDSEEQIADAVETALEECDVVLISGGSSVGTKDATCRIIESKGELLLHGIAIKPGKPTIMGKCKGKPVIGLPGHPGAAYFISEIFVRAFLNIMLGRKTQRYSIRAFLKETVGANNGREQYTAVRLSEEGGQLFASPIHSKSGLISSMAGADGYFCIGRDSEGIMAGDPVDVFLFDHN